MEFNDQQTTTDVLLFLVARLLHSVNQVPTFISHTRPQLCSNYNANKKPTKQKRNKRVLFPQTTNNRRFQPTPHSFLLLLFFNSFGLPMRPLYFSVNYLNKPRERRIPSPSFVINSTCMLLCIFGLSLRLVLPSSNSKGTYMCEGACTRPCHPLVMSCHVDQHSSIL